MKLLQRINLTTVIVALLTFVIGWQLGHRDLKLQWQNYQPQISLQNQQPPDKYKSIDFKLFWETWDLVSKEYFDKKAVDLQKMYYGAISGMVKAIGDPYTVFLPPDAQKSTKEELGGSFEGVGIQLGFSKEKRLVVIAPLKDTPAQKIGIKPQDMIIKIDDKDTTDMSLPDAVNLIRGPKGTKVTLEIYRDGDQKPRPFTLQRDTIVVKSVEVSQKTTSSGKKIAILKLTRFGDRTFDEWTSSVSEALSFSPEGIILDVRNNPGGYLEGAIDIASEFLDSGTIVIQEDANGGRKVAKVNRNGRLTKLPLIALINKGSASASEIVAGALQDHKRARLVGEQSFGKGTIQEPKDLPEKTGIHITTAKWLTPNGRWIHETGLTPDVKAENVNDQNEQDSSKEEKDEQLDKALELLN